MKTRKKLCLASLVVLGALGAFPRGQGLSTVWEINLNVHIKEPDHLFGPSTHSIQGIAFSPNEEYIAVAVGVHPSVANPRQGTEDYFSHVVILRTKNPGQDFQQFEPGILADEKTLTWSPLSSTLLVKGGSRSVIIGTDGYVRTFKELGCHPPGLIEGFLDERHFLTESISRDAARSSHSPTSVLDSFNLDCKLLDQWSPNEDWPITDIEPRRGLAAAFREIGRAREDFVFELDSKRIVQRWRHTFGEKFFAESGRSLCAIATYWRGTPGPVCWDIATGEKIAELPKINGGLPASVGRYSSRILLSDYKVYLGITEEFDMHEFKRRMIWDFRTGKELASWVPETQSVELPHHPAREHAVLSAFALSPTGRYVAEGADGVLRLYEVGGDAPPRSKSPSQ